jgi:hypothetical protein
MKYAKITSSIWGTLEDTIITGHEMGEIMMWDMRKKTNESLLRIRPHSKKVMDLQKDKEGTCFVSASKDYTAKVIHLFKFCLKIIGFKSNGNALQFEILEYDYTLTS